MARDVVLHGYRISVYTRAARMVLTAKGVAYGEAEVNPFDPKAHEGYEALHPFFRVPVLVADGFTVYETAAITRYVDAAFPGPALTPEAPEAAARMAQVIGVVDAYAYWPLVRQVFVQLVANPHSGELTDEAEAQAGLAAAPRIFAALEAIAVEGRVLVPDALTLADCHLAPMIGYFAAAPEGAEMLAQYDALSAWWAAIRTAPAFYDTEAWPPK